MIALIQRVSLGKVVVDDTVIGDIKRGIVALIGVEKRDAEKNAERLLARLLGYRIFADANNRMNLSVGDVGGGLLLIPQFTLVANTKKGTKPSFSSAAPPEQGKALFHYLVGHAKQIYEQVETGQFGVDMQVHLVNEGPVTFWLTA